MGSLCERSELKTSSKKKMSSPSPTNAQPALVVLTIPTQNDNQSEKEHIMKLFPKKYILTFSIIQLSCAALAATSQMLVFGFRDHYYDNTSIPVMVLFNAGIWTGFFFGISGGLGIFASHRPSNGKIIAFMVLSIISIFFVLPLLFFALLGFWTSAMSHLDEHNYLFSRKTLLIICYGIQIVIGLLQGVVAITASAYSCRAVCCGRRIYPRNLADTEEEKPPAYDTVAAKQLEGGNRYQRFD